MTAQKTEELHTNGVICILYLFISLSVKQQLNSVWVSLTHYKPVHMKWRLEAQCFLQLSSRNMLGSQSKLSTDKAPICTTPATADRFSTQRLSWIISSNEWRRTVVVFSKNTFKFQWSGFINKYMFYVLICSSASLKAQFTVIGQIPMHPQASPTIPQMWKRLGNHRLVTIMTYKPAKPFDVVQEPNYMQNKIQWHHIKTRKGKSGFPGGWDGVCKASWFPLWFTASSTGYAVWSNSAQ